MANKDQSCSLIIAFLLQVFYVVSLPAIQFNNDEKVIEEWGKNRIINLIDGIFDEVYKAGTNNSLVAIIQNESITMDSLTRDSRWTPTLRNEIVTRIYSIRRTIIESAANIEIQSDFKLKIDDKKFQVESLNGVAEKDPLEIQSIINNISLKSLELGMNLVEEMSRTLYDEAIRVDSFDEKLKLSIEYTAYVYVFTDIVCQILRISKLQNSENIKDLHNKRNLEIVSLEKGIRTQKQELFNLYKNDQIGAVEFEKRIIDINIALDIAYELRKNWEDIYETMEAQYSWLQNLKNQIPYYERTMESAVRQLRILSITGEIVEERKFLYLELPEIPEPPPLLPMDSSFIKKIEELKKYSQ